MLDKYILSFAIVVISLDVIDAAVDKIVVRYN